MLIAMLLIEGVLVTYKGGQELARERYRDDGATLSSHVTALGKELVEEVARNERKVRFDFGGRKGEVAIPDGVVVLENFFWQEYALAAEGRPADGRSRPVKVLVPAQGLTLDGTILVRAGAEGGKHVEVTLQSLRVDAEIGSDGRVTHVTIPAQGVEVIREGAKPPVVEKRAPPAGVVEEPAEVTRAGVTLRGVLWLPPDSAARKPPLFLVIAGSGATDRDGNNTAGLHTDAYRQLAEALVRRGAAVLRYDKRGVGASDATFDPTAVVLDDFVADAAAFADRARASGRFAKLVVAGHSEGGLIATLLAARTKVDALVLLAAPGRPFGAILHEQLARQLDAATLVEFDRLLGELRAGRPISTDKLPARVAVLLHPTVRRFIQSLLPLDPAALLHGVHLPTTIVQGTTDIQISVGDAEALAKARPDAKLVLVEHANHLFKEEAQKTPAQASYSDPTRPLVPAAVDAVAAALP